MPLTEKQQEYLHHCNHRWNVKVGAVGSGKSFADITVTIPKRILASKDEGLLVLMGNTRGTLERNILEPMRAYWPGLVGDIKSDNTVMIFGRKVYALGADSKKHVARIQGATFEYVYGDEITTWSQDVFEMLKSRLRCEHSHFDGTCNPASPVHWFKQFLDSDADIYQQSYIIDDGVLPDEIVTQLKKEYTGMYYDRYILGQWCQAEGLVYPYPIFDKERNVFDEHGDEGEWYVSVDYGASHPTVFELWRIKDGTAWLEREYYHDGQHDHRTGQKTNEQYYQDLLSFIGSIPVKYIIIDPSASLKVNIQQGRKFHTINADNEVIRGITFTGDLLRDSQIMIHRSCTHLIEELGLYSWDPSRTEDAVVKEHDHCCDAMRYLAWTMRRRFRTRQIA